MHWINAVAMFIMIGSGWKIYNDEVIFGWLHFPEYLTIGHWAQHGLQFHFFGMWIIFFNGIAYVSYGLATGRFRRMLLPIRLSGLIDTVRDALRLKLAHDDPTKYNTVPKAALYWRHRCRGPGRDIGARDLETGSILGTVLPLWKFSDGTAGPFPLYDSYRPVPDRSCRPGPDRALDPGLDVHGRTFRRPRSQ